MLMYHHVNPSGDFINSRPGIFENHIRFLKDHGFTALHTGELNLILNGIKTPPRKPVMITFDDGWLDNWLFAFPILKKYNMKAVIFIITSMIAERERRQRSDEGVAGALPTHRECRKIIKAGRGDEVMLSWDELGEMEGSGIVDIQSHTHTHQRWDKLYSDRNRLRDTLLEELDISREMIKDKLGKDSNALCWPWGVYDREYIDIARSSGYEMLFTCHKGTNSGASDIMEIRRIAIANTSRFNLRKKLLIHSHKWLSNAYLKYFS